MTLFVGIDWDKNGNFTGVHDDMTDTVAGGTAGRLECQYGRNNGLDPMPAGTGSLVLLNRSRKYTPRNTSSPLFGKLKPARPFLAQRIVDGNTYTLFRAHGDDSALNPDVESKTVSMSLVDNLGDLRGKPLSTAVFEGLRTGELIGAVLDAIGWTGGRDLDTGVTQIPFWWEDGTDAFTAVEKLVRAEGSPAFVTVDSSGGFVFRDRHHRITRTASTTSQATFRAGGQLEPVMGKGFTPDESWRNIVNDVTVSVDVYRRYSREVVWQYESPIRLDPGGSRSFVLEFDTPVTGLQTPIGISEVEAEQPYTDGSSEANTGQPRSYFNVATDDGLGAGFTRTFSRTSGKSAVFTLTHSTGSSPATLTNLTIVGFPVRVEYTVQVSATNPTSITDYGSRGLPFDGIPWGTPDNVQRIIDRIVAERAQPLTLATFRVNVGKLAGGTVHRSNVRAKAVLARNFSDRITIVEPESGISSDFYVEKLQHDMTGEDDHVVTVTAEAVPPVVAPALADQFTFDVNTAGRRFDSGKFA